jgi:hypothetical protein
VKMGRVLVPPIRGKNIVISTLGRKVDQWRGVECEDGPNPCTAYKEKIVMSTPDRTVAQERGVECEDGPSPCTA